MFFAGTTSKNANFTSAFAGASFDACALRLLTDAVLASVFVIVRLVRRIIPEQNFIMN